MPDETGTRLPRIPIAPIDAVPPQLSGGAVAVGNFDGLHLGHRRLLDLTLSEARACGIPAVLLTFEPHPRSVLQPDRPVFRVTPLAAKARLLTVLGFDGMVVVPFDRTFAARGADDFVSDILIDRLAIKATFVGFDFHFGRRREGSPDYLRRQGEHRGFKVGVVEPVLADDGQPYSTTRVRHALVAGDIDEANRLLGYRWFVVGTVVSGDRRGRELGYPTANIRLDPGCRLRHGIYAVRLAGADGVTRDAVASFGRRPTFDDGPPMLEVHVFDFSGSLYDQDVVVTFVAWLRGEERFDSAAALVAQMDRDSAAARAALAAAGPGSRMDQLLPRVV